MRTTEAARLDRLQLAAWPKAQQGDLRAIDTVLRILQRRASLFGLDMPTRVDVTTMSQPIKAYVSVDGSWKGPDEWDDLLPEVSRNGHSPN